MTSLRALLLPAVFALTTSCSPSGARGLAELPTGSVTSVSPGNHSAGGASASGRGAPTVSRQVVNDEFSGPPGFFCDFAVDAHAVGQFVIQQWTSASEELIYTETNVHVTFTNVATGASITNHQTNATQLRVIDGNFVEITDSGGLLRVISPGEGIVAQETGHLVVTFDYSTDPPGIAVAFRGRSAGVDICALIE